MVPLYWAGCIVLGYLYGSVNFSIIFSKLVYRVDIRTLGNLNPGTANMARSFGAGWGVIVLFLDVSKGVLPMLLAKQIDPFATTWLNQVLLLAVGVAAFFGHCKPLFFRFRGGGGIATSIGVFGVLVLPEMVFSLLFAAALVSLFIRGEHTIGPYVSVFFVVLTPFVTLATTLLLDIQITESLLIGGHEWYVVASVFAMAFTIMGIDIGHLMHRMRSLKDGKDPTQGFEPGGDTVRPEEAGGRE